MKKLSTLFFSLLLSCSLFAQTSNTTGNGKTGFGGPVGNGSLDITTAGDNITFTFNRGASGGFNDALVIYIDAAAGGYTSTASFMDASSDLMKAISGYDGATNRATFNFSSTFTPEKALALFANGSKGAVLVNLGTTMHTIIDTPILSNNGNTNAPSYTVTFPSASLGLSGTSSFKFLATYISGTGYRADEAIGDPMTGFSQGWNAYTSTTTPPIFNGTFPVTLARFTGSYEEGASVLNWITKTESNVKSFDVQRSINSVEWTTVSSVKATNRINGSSYSYTDNNSFKGAIYYRLKMVDNDGSFKYSNVIKLSSTAVSEVRLMGNPVKNEIRLNITNSESAKYTVEVVSTDGRKVKAVNYSHSAGVSNVVIPADGLMRGTYFVKVSNGATQTTLPFTVN